MPVTYTTPITQPDEVQSRVFTLQVDHNSKTALIRVERLNSSANVIRTSIYTVGDDDADYTWAQFVSNVPSLGTIRNEIETALQNAGEIPAGPVT